MMSNAGSSWRPLTVGLAVLAGVARLVPHPANFTPVGALGILAGARMSGWKAVAIPLAVMAASDLALYWVWDYPPFDPFVYTALLVNVALGLGLRGSESPARIGGVAILASVLFFLITNLGVWLIGDIYSRDLAGLGACYLAGLPFFRNTLAGDLVFTGVLFALHAVLSRSAFPAERADVSRGVS